MKKILIASACFILAASAAIAAPRLPYDCKGVYKMIYDLTLQRDDPANADRFTELNNEVERLVVDYNAHNCQPKLPPLEDTTSTE